MEQIKIFRTLDKTSTDLIRKTIEENGNSPEHNLEYFKTMMGKGEPIFASFENFKGVLAVRKGKLITVISEVLAPEDERAGLFVKFMQKIYSDQDYSGCKIYLETSEEFKKDLSLQAKDLSIAGKTVSVGLNVYTYYTPIIYLDEWDETLSGSKMSNIRKSRNRLYRDSSIKLVKDDVARSVPYKEYETLVHAWRKNRNANDKVEYDKYLLFFEEGCKAADIIIAIVKDNVPIAVAAGWTVPNLNKTSNDKTIYYSINMHDYSLAELGDTIACEFITESKMRGYNYLDFGGSGEKLLEYKKKFNPKKQYIQQCYYISLK